MEEEVLKGKTLLVVDDEADLRDIMASEMEFMGARVFQAGNIAAAKEILKEGGIDLVISDIRMPGGTGVDLLEHVKAENPKRPVILITGFADITVEEAFNRGAEALLNKPFKLDDLIKVVARNTLPLETRFTEPGPEGGQPLVLEYDYGIQEALERRELLIGRGGMTLGLSGPRKKIEVNEMVEFYLKFNDRRLQGSAVCRWFKVQENGTKATVGLEFISISEDSLAFFIDHWKRFPTVTYMPVP